MSPIPPYPADPIQGVIDGAPASLDTLNEIAAAIGDDPAFAATVAAQVAASGAAIVDGAPATLDTLNELAASLGDDPDFATTVAGLIAAGDTAAAIAAKGVHFPNNLLPGTIFTNVVAGTAGTTGSPVANRLIVTPFIPKVDVDIDRISLFSTVNGDNNKIVVYADDGDFQPGDLIDNSPNLPMVGGAAQDWDVALSFLAGNVYWIGAHHESAVGTLVFNAAAALLPWRISSVGSGAATQLRGTATFASGVPATFPAISTFANSSTVACYMRAA